MKLQKRLHQLEKLFKPELQIQEFHIFFIGGTNDEPNKTTSDLILYANGKPRLCRAESDDSGR